jgi:thiol-disulfide isomerase/thioredoxin
MKFKKVIYLIIALNLVVVVCYNAGSDTQSSARVNYSNQIELVDNTKLDSLIQTRNGKALFINMWATWCVPCREEFPDLIKLVEYTQNRDIEIVGISVDYADEIDSKVRPFMQSQQVNFKIYVQNFDRQESLINKLNKEWAGALPASFLYNAQGEQVLYLPGKHSFEEFKQTIDSLLNNDLH